MARKPITDLTQNSIFIKSRRRCCLCFWLNGKDEVVKGQLAHLDQDHENNSEENLAFLCLVHHDEYDSKTSQSKGLREQEVRMWRNELYREMEYRFRSILKHGCEIRFLRFALSRIKGEIGCVLTIKNTGESSVKRPTVAIRLPENVNGTFKKPLQRQERGSFEFQMPVFETIEINGAREERLDVFEKNGRVVTWSTHPLHPVLMPNHTYEIRAIAFCLQDVMVDNCLELEYRIDYEEGTPSIGSFVIHIPESEEEFLMLFDEDER